MKKVSLILLTLCLAVSALTDVDVSAVTPADNNASAVWEQRVLP